MIKKYFSLFISFGIIAILVSSPLFITRAAASQSEQDDPPEDSEEETINRNAPYLSEDGLTLYNAVPPRVLVVDPNPEMQGLRFPVEPELAAAMVDSRSTRATFSITYAPAGATDPNEASCMPFPEGAKTAFNAAVAIWANTIQSFVPITISACWSNLGSPSILGYSGYQPLHRNFAGARQPNTWYQGSLANALNGSDLDPASFDMHITYNSTFSWYFGTDGQTPSGYYDLVTVAAHEIAHGLNFSGSAQYSAGIGSYKYINDPFIYDTFMEDLSGGRLSSYTNPSFVLGTLLTSDSLWWNGPNAKAANGGTRVKMYAPSLWAQGSSFSHLDYNTFAGSSNSMMVFSIGSGSSQHNPGDVTKGILKDMGWTIEPPSAPTDLSASEDFVDKVSVSWTASSGATYYTVYRNTSNTTDGVTELTGSPTGSPYEDTSAEPETPYYYWVKACNSGGCSDFSSSDQGWRVGELSIPSPSTGVSASDGTHTDKVSVSWNASSGATYYKVYRDTSDTTAGVTELTSSHAASPYEDTSAEPETPYYYWVKACNSGGCSGFSSSDQGWRAGELSIPSPSTGVSASDGTHTDKVSVSWNASSGATYYKVYRNTSDTTTGAAELTSSHAASPYEDTSAVPETPYYYWVKACNSGGCSAFSSSDQGWRALPSSTVSLVYLPLIVNGGGSSSPIRNGGFEAGRDGSWTETSLKGYPLIIQFVPGDVHSGLWAAWLGGDHEEVSRLSQSVTIPAAQPYLHFWLLIVSEDACGFDYACVKVNDTTVRTNNLCSVYNTSNWTSAVVNLSAYAGSTVTLQFEVTTDSSLYSSFYLDDVSLSSSSTAAAMGVDPLEGTPGLYLEKDQ